MVHDGRRGGGRHGARGFSLKGGLAIGLAGIALVFLWAVSPWGASAGTFALDGRCRGGGGRHARRVVHDVLGHSVGFEFERIVDGADRELALQGNPVGVREGASGGSAMGKFGVGQRGRRIVSAPMMSGGWAVRFVLLLGKDPHARKSITEIGFGQQG